VQTGEKRRRGGPEESYAKGGGVTKVHDVGRGGGFFLEKVRDGAWKKTGGVGTRTTKRGKREDSFGKGVPGKDDFGPLKRGLVCTKRGKGV